ncbi:YpjP family protein [Aquibacillus sediminis]|uniref:YpjP family protein n=1 Tax=Aquibacillus sediminis TaxID=2574734 RepID=UPI0011097793|nr:YpjP family protein [Aquibacillus sediminis]
MKIWIRKIFVVLIACMTLGLYIPSIPIETDADSKEVDTSKADANNDFLNKDQQIHAKQFEVSEPEIDNDYLVNALSEKAKEQAYSKLGPRIAERVEVDFMNDILPNLEEALQIVLKDAGEEKVPYFEITEEPQQGYGERIFNIYDYRTNEDIARFHVRRDNRPLEGYWFNFHYHLSKDQFEEHHEIGEIYWDKNTPPKWMS